ncbi:hypothetical protein HanRHA438_Chr07g0297511 [Helianthus annuus]|nr:hypothetical protein HanIR_Chr07g0309541 [Helianthus annuus]KAJ0907320.1 hypothetical protein HanRHA438_Chr07g0297511 [Helianthus annuus]
MVHLRNPYKFTLHPHNVHTHSAKYRCTYKSWSMFRTLDAKTMAMRHHKLVEGSNLITRKKYNINHEVLFGL